MPISRISIRFVAKEEEFQEISAKICDFSVENKLLDFSIKGDMLDFSISLENRVNEHKKRCHTFREALALGFLEIRDKELLISANCKALNPEIESYNVLTDETYDTANITIGERIAFCPFCGEQLDTSSEGFGEEERWY